LESEEGEQKKTDTKKKRSAEDENTRSERLSPPGGMHTIKINGTI